jgi:DNA-binding Lrp family transcriptional regulator
MKLDDIDLNILKVLQEEGRISNVKLSELVGITAPPCLRRVRALEDAGLIIGYHAELSAAHLGFDIVVFAMVGLHSQAENDLQIFEEKAETKRQLSKFLLFETFKTLERSIFLSWTSTSLFFC